jgi:hypothetical protein
LDRETVHIKEYIVDAAVALPFKRDKWYLLSQPLRLKIPPLTATLVYLTTSITPAFANTITDC